jgi:hypothetical protein
MPSREIKKIINTRSRNKKLPVIRKKTIKQAGSVIKEAGSSLIGARANLCDLGRIFLTASIVQ